MTPVTRLSATEALDHLRQIVAVKGPDFVYPKFRVPGLVGVELELCNYEREGQPSCGVGILLHQLGIPVPSLRALDLGIDGAGNDDGDSSISHQSTVDYLASQGLDLTPGAVQVLAAFQKAQDDREPYSQALATATTVFNHLKESDKS